MWQTISKEGFTMDKFLNVALIVAPILFAAALGILARKRAMLTAAQVQGLQEFVIKFGLPCVLFNSCLTAEVSPESVSTMVMIIPLAFIAAILAFRLRKTHFPFHNLPLLLCAKETGMLGIPLFIVLFGAAQSYHMGVLDLAQGIISIPVVTILAARSDENPSPARIAKSVLTSPMLVFSLLGLVLNLTGIRDMLNSIGIGSVITECTGFLGQPVSAIMLFSVGFNFSLSKKDLKTILNVTALHFGMHAVFCIIVQLLLCLIPNADPMSRWAILMYYMLPASFVSPSVGRTEDDAAVSSSVCSLLTVVSLIVFCVIAVAVA